MAGGKPRSTIFASLGESGKLTDWSSELCVLAPVLYINKPVLLPDAGFTWEEREENRN